MLGLRLDEPLLLGAELAVGVDQRAVLSRLERLGLVLRDADRLRPLRSRSRGRFLGGGVTADLLA